MFALSVLMLSSMHAIQATHIHHHRHCLDEEDFEAHSAKMSAFGALLFGPFFPLKLHREALRLATPRQQKWILCEIIAILLFVSVLLALGVRYLTYHVLAMVVGQSMTAFFAVWTVHHGCDGKQVIARTLRSRFKSIIAFDMFYHAEHHLFPKVPTCHLSQLAERLDKAAPEIGELQVY